MLYKGKQIPRKHFVKPLSCPPAYKIADEQRHIFSGNLLAARVRVPRIKKPRVTRGSFVYATSKRGRLIIS